jgi:antitoxin YefM
MLRMALTDDIRSLSEFRAHTTGFISQVHTTKRPLVITQNGKSAAVLLDVAEYEKLLDKIEVFEDVDLALNQVSEGKAVADSKAKHLLRARYPK